MQLVISGQSATFCESRRSWSTRRQSSLILPADVTALNKIISMSRNISHVLVVIQKIQLSVVNNTKKPSCQQESRTKKVGGEAYEFEVRRNRKCIKISLLSALIFSFSFVKKWEGTEGIH